MHDPQDYDNAADTIKIKNITSREQCQNILRQLKENDPSFDSVHMNIFSSSNPSHNYGYYSR